MMHVISADTKVADTIRYDTPSIGSDNDTDPIIVRSLLFIAIIRTLKISAIHGTRSPYTTACTQHIWPQTFAIVSITMWNSLPDFVHNPNVTDAVFR